MANGILTQLNQSLEITVQDGLDGLADFTLQLAYARTGAQFKILSDNPPLPSEINSPKNLATLTLVDTPIADTHSQPVTRRQRHA
jgi:hypothetical protein